MATWTTYGTWLQGNKKGYVKNGTTLEANPELEKSNKELLKHDKIKIPKTLRIIVKNAILKEAEEISQKVYAIAVCSNMYILLLKVSVKDVVIRSADSKKQRQKHLENTAIMTRCGQKDLTKDIVIMSRN